jgi:hypothetical protein
VGRETFVLICVLLGSPVLRAESVTITATRDNTLYESITGGLSNGAGDYFFAGTTVDGAIRRGLIGFDVAGSVPAGSVITAATLRLHMSRTPAAVEPVTVHRLLAEWGEGASDAPGEEGAGGNPATGDATWIHTFFAAASWSQPGGDFVPESSASASVIGTGYYDWGSTPGMIADVQGWLDQPGSNFGWLVMGNEEFPLTAKRFDSREHPNPAMRPSLAIEYRPVPEPASAAMAGMGLGFVLVGRRSRRSRRRSS